MHDFSSDIDAVDRVHAVPAILDVVCDVTGMGFAAIARVTRQRWVCLAVKDKIAFGLRPGDELKVETTICREVRDNREPVVIDNVARDEAYCGHPTPAMYGFQSYISMPIFLNDGSFYGTLCAIDPKPADLNNPKIIGLFRLFAELIAFHLDTGRRLASSEARLINERKSSELREQFIAVLGHDLRNPLAPIAAGATLMEKAGLDEKSRMIIGTMQKSISRMSALIDNVLDLARGRLGGGITLKLEEVQLAPVLKQVVDELKSTHPEQRIDTHFNLGTPVRCDQVRIAQLLSNLLGNALTHGAPGEPVRVEAGSNADVFELSVANAGKPIPAGRVERLFLPFSRGDDNRGGQGLGLGLYIAAEIGRAHQGKFEVKSTPAETRFTFRMPSA
ncbi:MAG: GAF domain-containing sensor histidine kinase [Xanthobacteraceae bacterium]